MIGTILDVPCVRSVRLCQHPDRPAHPGTSRRGESMMTHRRLMTTLVAGAAACAAVLAGSGTAVAGTPPKHHPPTVTVLDRTVAAPFQLDHARGSLIVADGGTSLISRLTRTGLKTIRSTEQ